MSYVTVGAPTVTGGCYPAQSGALTSAAPSPDTVTEVVNRLRAIEERLYELHMVLRSALASWHGPDSTSGMVSVAEDRLFAGLGYELDERSQTVANQVEAALVEAQRLIAVLR